MGPGGVGKTRLAVRTAEAVATQYPFGGVFVNLVPVREGFVTQAVAALLGITERPGRSLDAALHEYLARGRSLLVLDNCEHLLTVVAAFVEKLLADCSGLTVLVTSRERLAVPGERTVTIPPLSLVAEDTDDAEARRPRRCSSTGPGPSIPSSPPPPRWWGRSARAWTGCRWPSSWPRPAARRWA